jgi:excisionase family DNA binding protein
MSQELNERLARIEQLLTISAKEVFDINEAALFLGLSKSRVYHLTSQREIPHYKQGKSVYFKKTELEDWMTAQRIPTDAEVVSQAVSKAMGFK